MSPPTALAIRNLDRQRYVASGVQRSWDDSQLNKACRRLQRLTVVSGTVDVRGQRFSIAEHGASKECGPRRAWGEGTVRRGPVRF